MADEGPRLKGLPVSAQWAGHVLVTLLFVEHALLGGVRPELGLAFSGLYGALLCWNLMDPARRLAGLEPARLLVPGLLFAAVLGLSGFTVFSGRAADPSLALIELVKLAGLACIFLTAAMAARSTPIPRLMRWIAILGSLYLGGFLLSHLVNPDSLLGQDKFTALGRYTGSFVSANTAAMASAILALLACAVLIEQQQRAMAATPLWWRRLSMVFRDGGAAVVLAVLALGSLVLTVSRAGVVLGAGAVLLLLMWELLLGHRRGRVAVSALAGLTVTVILLGGGNLMLRLGRTVEAAALRGDINAAHWQAFLQAPWMGAGLGSFDVHNRAAMTPENFQLLTTVHAAHNVYLQWLEQAGVLGAGLMFACLGALVAPVALAAFSPRRTTVWTRAIVLVCAVLFLQGAVDYALEAPSISGFLAMLLGFGWAAAGTPSVAAGAGLAERHDSVSMGRAARI